MSGERFRKAASFLTARMYSRWVAGTKLPTVMSSSMRARSGLMGFSLIGVSCLEVGVLDPSILKTERPFRYRPPVSWLALPEPLAQTFARSALPRERVRSTRPSRPRQAQTIRPLVLK
ncbi:protein of unknown function [Hyphomicrobium sp. 1Nfss2.1]